ncbi:MAG: division/cell wall cluster transcriptional repressor MraZ [Planctomycetota bacterium]|jgi:MraZ protein
MRLFAGQYERSIDDSNRMQLPRPLRLVVDPDKEGCTLIVTLGENRGTLAILTPEGFEDIATRIPKRPAPGPQARRSKFQFYGIASPVEMDKQGRIVLPDRLCKKAGLSGEVYLIGLRNRIEIWNRAELSEAMGIDWDSKEWVEWNEFLSDGSLWD